MLHPPAPRPHDSAGCWNQLCVGDGIDGSPTSCQSSSVRAVRARCAVSNTQRQINLVVRLVESPRLSGFPPPSAARTIMAPTSNNYRTLSHTHVWAYCVIHARGEAILPPQQHQQWETSSTRLILARILRSRMFHSHDGHHFSRVLAPRGWIHNCTDQDIGGHLRWYETPLQYRTLYMGEIAAS